MFLEQSPEIVESGLPLGENMITIPYIVHMRPNIK
jgi:hypothetical protein